MCFTQKSSFNEIDNIITSILQKKNEAVKGKRLLAVTLVSNCPSLDSNSECSDSRAWTFSDSVALASIRKQEES